MTAKRNINNIYPFEGIKIRVDYSSRHCRNCIFTDDCIEETSRPERFEKLHNLKPCFEKPECHYIEVTD